MLNSIYQHQNALFQKHYLFPNLYKQNLKHLTRYINQKEQRRLIYPEKFTKYVDFLKQKSKRKIKINLRVAKLQTSKKFLLRKSCKFFKVLKKTKPGKNQQKSFNAPTKKVTLLFYLDDADQKLVMSKQKIKYIKEFFRNRFNPQNFKLKKNKNQGILYIKILIK